MSLASKQAVVRFSPKAGTYTAVIQSPSGDLYQEYSGTAEKPGSIQPDFSKNHPQLIFIATSSRVAEGIVEPTEIEWYFNDTRLTFDAITNKSTNPGLVNLFESVTVTKADKNYRALNILNNLVIESNAAPCTIKAKANVTFGIVSDVIQAQYGIPIRKSEGSSFIVTIASGDNAFFTITEQSGSCVLKAITYQSGSEVKDGLTYKWYKMQGDSWNLLEGPSYTGQAITVHQADVACYGNYKVEVFKSNKLIGMDIQGVIDASDPYDIIPYPNPKNETIENPGDTVVYTPKLVKRGSTTPVNNDVTFNFNAIDSVGNSLGSAQSKASFTVDYAMCIQSGADVGVYIETSI